MSCAAGIARPFDDPAGALSNQLNGVLVLDVFFVAGIVVLFAIVALVARGVEKL